MKAAVTTQTHSFEIVELPHPTPGPGELLIRVTACGVCGSDTKAQPLMPPGVVMGHEFGGPIVATGSGAEHWRIGTTVAVLPVLCCGACRYCATGAVAHCVQARYVGMGAPGGYAELALVPARHAFALPGELTDIHAALVEPFAVGLHAVHTAAVEPGEQVLVGGAGGVGLTTIAWLATTGATRITAVDPDPLRRNTAHRMGATDAVESVTDCGGRSYDAVIECVGHPDLLRACRPVVRPLGRIVIAGACADATPIEPVTALLNELTIRYSVCYLPDEFREVIRAFASGRIDPAPWSAPNSTSTGSQTPSISSATPTPMRAFWLPPHRMSPPVIIRHAQAREPTQRAAADEHE